MKRTIDLMQYLPVYYLDNKTMENLQRVNGRELEEFYKKIETSINQFFVPSATEEGLKSWEELLEIPRNLALSTQVQS